MTNLKLHTPNLTQSNISRIRELFPNCITETLDANGQPKSAIDFDQLRQELSESIVEGPQERYQLNWPGKREALLTANAPIAKTLRPCREESVDFDTTQNLFIESDNLDALKLLQETYLGKVKLIYIDPPYNTGNDFIYEDDFTEDSDEFLIRSNQKDETGNRLIANTESNGRFHSDWLSMIFSRLKLARNLLTEDGIIILSIDENEHNNLVKLGSLVFGDDNFCGEIVWKNSSKNDQKYISIQHEYLIVYVKSKQNNLGDWIEKKSGLAEIYQAFEVFKNKYGENWEAIHNASLEWFKQFPESNPISDSKHYTWMDKRGVYFPDNISGPNDGQYVYDVMHPLTGQPCKLPSTGWRYPESSMLDRIADNRVHFGSDHTTIPNNKTYLKDTEYQSLTSMRFVDGRSASKRLNQLFGEKIFTNPKDEYLLKDIFKAMNVKGNDIIVDFFAGSASTMHAVLELNKECNSHCQSILVQLPEDLNVMYKTAKGTSKKVIENAISFLDKLNMPKNIAEISKERIRRAGKKIKEELAAKKSTDQTLFTETEQAKELDIGFRVLKVDTSNMADVYYVPDAVKQDQLGLNIDNVKPGRTPEDLLFQVLLDWGVDLTLPIRRETIQGKTVFFVNHTPYDLIACFDHDVNEDLVKELARYESLRVVFRDNGFESDAVKINVDQIFKQLSPGTEVRAI